MCKLHVYALMESPVVSKSPVGVVGEWRGGDKRQVPLSQLGSVLVLPSCHSR